MSDYPTCPECGGSTRGLLGDALVCRVCEAMIEVDADGKIVSVTALDDVVESEG